MWEGRAYPAGGLCRPIASQKTYRLLLKTGRVCLRFGMGKNRVYCLCDTHCSTPGFLKDTYFRKAEKPKDTNDFRGFSDKK